MSVAFRNIKAVETLTKQQLLDKDFVREAVEHDMAFMHGIPNTVQYWTKRKKDLFAMIRQLGKSTAFLTLSASEMHWPDLLDTSVSPPKPWRNRSGRRGNEQHLSSSAGE